MLRIGVVLFRQLLVFLMVLSLTPGVAEFLENVEHILHDGHLAHSTHSDDEVHTASVDAEHGCTPMSHSCGCHSSMPAVLSESPTVQPQRLAAELESRSPGDVARLVSRANAPPVPPPTA